MPSLLPVAKCFRKSLGYRNIKVKFYIARCTILFVGDVPAATRRWSNDQVDKGIKKAPGEAPFLNAYFAVGLMLKASAQLAPARFDLGSQFLDNTKN